MKHIVPHNTLEFISVAIKMQVLGLFFFVQVNGTHDNEDNPPDVPFFTSSTLYLKNSFIHIARHLKSSLYGRGIVLSFYWNLLDASQITFRHRRVRVYAFFGQPLSKQLYTECDRTSARAML